MSTRSPPPRRHNLPLPLTTFVGREREVAEVTRLLGVTRLLTLTGTGGVGKTRLALEVAGQLVDQFPDGVWLAELASSSDPLLVPGTVASGLGLKEQPGRPILQTVREYVQDRSLLLILDNCEHLVEACAALADDLLRTCPGLQILATSREVLGVAGEIPWRVPSLAVVAEVGDSSIDELRACEAIHLFVERATTFSPSFNLDTSNSHSVVQMCRRLDGVPLAIELAAARVRLLAPEQIAARLDDRFKLLTGGSRAALPRQQTLRATIDWSYDLLSDAERTLLRRLAVFAGGWTLEAAEQMCAVDDTLDVLGHLVDKSLVLVDQAPGKEARFRMLETIRQYAEERLVEAGEVVELRNRHLAWCRALVESLDWTAMPVVTRPFKLPPEVEHDNFRAALTWGQKEPGAGDDALRLAGSLHFFWYTNGYFSEGMRWIEQALMSQAASLRDAGLPESTESLAARARALLALGNLARHQDFPRATSALEESAALYRQVGNARGACLALGAVGEVASSQGDHARAVALVEEALDLAREVHDAWWEASMLYRVGKIILVTGDVRRADDLLRQAESSGWGTETGMTAVRLGRAAHAARDGERAIALLEEALAHLRQLGFRQLIGVALHQLALVLHAEGQDERATTLLEEALAAWWDMGDPQTVAECLETVAGVVVARGRPEAAARLFGAVAASRKEIGAPTTPLDLPIVERDIARIRSSLGEQAFKTAWAKGEATSVEQAVGLGLSTLRSIGETAPRSEPTADADRVSSLTRREQEIAVLMARGLTNRQIADTLVISERTASTHITNILGKLGFVNRAQVAAWVVEQGWERRPQVRGST
ncbi:MAG TPA: LuxR C-terminal-related transcriptional regulator [Chloroflexota bacterium]|nr:LuxR C-terminal-related transcriptional regulator [Chloroflexota bacterium]